VNNTHGTRGRSLEFAVKQLFKSYESRGIFCQQNFPETLGDGTRIHNHGFDFQILYKGTFYAFDAKESNTPKWSLSNAKLHQVKALSDVAANGGISFFLVYFKKERRLVKMPINIVIKALEENKKTLSAEDGEDTKINILGVANESN
jgi:recombination protein U